MALPPSLDPGPRSEPLNHPPGAPRELDIAECTICPSEEERIRPEQAQTPGQDSLCPSEHLQGGLKNTEPTSGHPRLPTPYSHEDSTGGKHRESPLSGWEVLEAEQDHLHLCLLGLGRRLQDLEQGLGSWTLAQNGMVQLQTLQADLRGTAECVDALLTFSEGLAQRSEPQAWASLQQVLRALGAHRDSIFWRLWRLQAQLVSYSLVFKEANTLDQDLETEADSDCPGPGGIWGSWEPSSLPTPAELEWDPAGDIGGFGPLGQKTAWTPGAPCELCGHRGPQSRGQGLEDIFMLGLSHQKHLVGHQRLSLLQKSQDKKTQASSSLQDVMLEVDPGALTTASRRPLTFLLLFLLLVGFTLLLSQSGGPCCSPAPLARTPYLVLNYVNGLPPI
ncbi:nesprin-4 isoform X1 [Pipistrellus kuhlii]|uniref:Spectrin repeat containing nuclear envelope family member 4 n=1 Tax=Pipistrellus kuhlii TaxID=59472 RepID=A0A7J7V1U4_PIPKU|nr:nesprin-4 isoform X1 [Pipistrellus kuhlii]KAF6318946.1 spectrin repeat containing nuclear envelope family member 4 [Pipistrellus kuhlii]